MSVIAQKLVVYPCTDFDAIRWVRDATFCNQYYICHFGQPLAMPSCPGGQVWSNAALNCVPQDSRWDDCSGRPRPLKTEKRTTKNYRLSTVTRRPLQTNPSTSPRTTTDVVITVNNLPREIKVAKSKKTPILRNDSKNLDVKDDVSLGYPHYIVDIGSHDGIGKKISDILRSDDSDIDSVHTSRPKERNVKNSEGNQLENRFLHEKDARSDHSLRRGSQQKSDVDFDHECFNSPGALLPHPDNCHWYFNCSFANLEAIGSSTGQLESYQDVTESSSSSDRDGVISMQPFRVIEAGLFVWECRYPQLFDDITGKCREFVNVDCKSRFEAVDQCEYSVRRCRGERCVPCSHRFGHCRGRPDGVYPLHQDGWTPEFVACYRQRSIARDECVPPTPIFSPQKLECVSLFDVPKTNGGFLPDCSTRPDGYYPDEQGRCGIFFRCALGMFRGYDECPPGTVFDPAIPACQTYSLASSPCGESHTAQCTGKMDGYYADPYGRCTNYFQCQRGVFQQYLSCDLGIFDPLTQKCVLSAELTVRPCGLQPSPCEELPTGVYPDIATGCQHFIECHHGNMITNGTCEAGEVFSAITGKCGLPEYAPPPCGMSTMCVGQADGRYPATTRGCSFFYECLRGDFLGLRRCTQSDGGIFFNPDTGTCDYPQNICPPCGYKWWGW
ncbi:hypothetical protein BsWGS_04160 [Bradybaena similaris]